MIRFCLLLLFTSGCYGKFIAAAPELNTARLQVNYTTQARVELGRTADDGLLGAIVNTVQAVRSADQTRRIRQAIQPQDIHDATYQGLVDGLQDGIPFSITEDANADAMVRLNIKRHGMFVPFLGAPGRFDYVARLKIYNRERKRIYSKRLRCWTGVGSPDSSAEILGVVNNVKQLKSMSDEEINQTFMDVSAHCGWLFAMKMKQHSRE